MSASEEREAIRREASSVRDFFRTVLPPDEGVAAMLSVYIDESGIHESSKVVTSASAWADAETWEKWTTEWCAAIHPVQVYHASDCHNLTGAFKGWSHDKRNAFVRRALPVIARHPIQGTIGGLHRKDVVQVMNERPAIKDIFGDIYLFAFIFNLLSTWNTIESQGHKEVAFFHELQDEYKGPIEYFFNLERKKRNSDASITFMPKRGVMGAPLQCADILAYEGNHYLRDTTKPFRWSLKTINPSGDRFAVSVANEALTTDLASYLCEQYPRRAW